MEVIKLKQDPLNRPQSHITGKGGKFGRRDRRTGKSQIEMKAKIRVMLLQGKEHQRLPANPQKLCEGPGPDSFSQPPEGTNTANTLIADF